jgi:ribosomal protein S18 acetylase RimI-like enzyme
LTAHPVPLASDLSRSVTPASTYTFDQLAGIYNQARVDYIVPMPMNGKRMSEYVRYYDIDLKGSFVSLNSDHEETGIAMLGVRGDRSWITRLGVIPERRGHKIGQYLTENLLEESLRRKIRRVQLEVIVGNQPAYQLFTKLGFEPVRELLVIRRPPGAPAPDEALEAAYVTEILDVQIPSYLAQRTGEYSWLDENASMLNIGNLKGYEIELSSGESGWVIFQRAPFQLTHLVISPDISPDVLRAGLYHIHKEFAMQDTKIENLPVFSTSALSATSQSLPWLAFQSMGYFEVFRRIEMMLYLNQ